MKMLAKVILLLFLTIPAFANELQEIKEFGNNPGNLKMFVHQPEELKKSAPLVVALHGCSQNARQLAEQAGWNQLADSYGFIVLYPQQKRINNVSNCFNWFRSEDTKADKSGELVSIRQMIEYAADNYVIDTQKIYVYGLSAGAAMSVALLANYPQVFEAGAIFAGAPYGAAKNQFQAMQAMLKVKDKTSGEWLSELPYPRDTSSNRPRVIIVQGTEDLVVHPKNSEELLEQWTAYHQLDQQSDSTIAYTSEVQCSLYQNEDGETVVYYYQIKNLGHALAIDPGSGERQGGQPGIFTKDLGFFSTYYVARDFGLLFEFVSKD